MLMKTVFKVGMEVWDNIFFPKSKGVVFKIDKRNDCEKVVVRFDKWDYEVIYTEQGRLINTYKDASPTLSTSPYTLQGFEQKEPAKTYEEALKWCIGNLKDYRECVCTEYVNEKQENALEALRKLIILRDYYNEGWQPDWKDNFCKYTIECYESELYTDDSYNFDKVMSFKTEELRDKFLEEQKELLEIAKPLL